MPAPLPYGRRALSRPLPSASQLLNRQEGAHVLFDLVAASALPPHTTGFALQILDVTHVWSGRDSGVIEYDDILALTAAIFSGCFVG